MFNENKDLGPKSAPPECARAITRTLQDPATSHWLRTAISQALERDPVDALADAEHLVQLLRLQLNMLMGQHGVANTSSH